MVLLLSVLWLLFFGAINYITYDKFIGIGETHENSMKYAALTVSFVHATMSSLCAILILYSIFDKITVFNASTPIFKECISITMGYFLQDFAYIVKTVDKSNMRSSIMYIIHHIGFTLICLWVIYANKYHGLAAICLFAEFSTIILNVHQYFKYRARHYFVKSGGNVNNKCFKMCEIYDNYAYKAFIIFALVFFSVRISNTLLATMFYYNQIVENSTIILSAVAFSTILNTIWLTHIVNMIVNYIFVKNSKKIE